MESSHPHSGATYRILGQADGSSGIEVTIPGTYPTLVTVSVLWRQLEIHGNG
jgi:hypothetical protein